MTAKHSDSGNKSSPNKPTRKKRSGKRNRSHKIAPDKCAYRRKEEQQRDKQGAPPKGVKGWRLWLFRAIASTIGPALLLLSLEITLRIAGYGHPATLFVETERKETLTTNEWFVWFYHKQRSTRPHPYLVSAMKPENTIRVFVLGESAAMGTPDPSFGFGRILEVMLQQYFPNHQVEVINAAMRAINSHIIVPISRQCAGLKPDLFVVYMGNNEVIGLYGPESFLGRYPSLISALHRVKQTRVCQLVRNGVKRGLSAFQPKEETQTIEFFRQHRMALDDPRRKAVYRNYRNNLVRICDNGLQSGAGMLILTVPVNLRDCPPLASLHRNDLTSQDLHQWESFYHDGIEHENKQNQAEAIACYLKAAAIDSHYAELHFRLGRCYLATGEKKTARDHFSLARDWDALQFRADSRFNEIVRQVAEEYDSKKVYLVDAESALAVNDRCQDGIPGSELFYDHVHLRFDGDYELAKTILPSAIRVLQKDRGFVPSASASISSRDECARRLAFTAWDKVNTAAAMVKMTTRAPFTDQLDHSLRQSRAEQAISQVMTRVDEKFVSEVLQSYHDAIRINPDDWHLHYNLGTFFYQLERFPEAAEHIEYVVNTFPNVSPFQTLLGYVLARTGYLDQAIVHFRQALERDSRHKPAKEALDWALQQKRDRAVPTLRP
jgi:tetratricopeptide (TPR) repeat protein